jgi:hypothetical protein
MYKRTMIRIDADKYPKINYCEGCNKKKGECGQSGKPIKKLDTHHWKYEFSSKEVKAKPELVLKNTSVLCFRCHRVGDAIRISFEDKPLTDCLLELRAKAVF